MTKYSAQDVREARALLVRACESHAGMLRGVAAKVVGDRSHLDDIVQDALANALAAQTGAPLDSPKAYLIVTVRNVALRYARRDAGCVASLDEFEAWDVADNGPLPDRIVEGRERLRVLAGAVDALPTQCRTVFMLKKIRGLTQAQIARELQIAESTVEKHLIKAMKRCRALVSAYDSQGQMGGLAVMASS